MTSSIKYQDFLIEHLKNHDEAVAYLNAAFEESLKGDEESEKIFLMALENVAKAQKKLPIKSLESWHRE